MALTSTTKGFWPRKNIGGKELPESFEFIIDANEVLTLGDAVDLNSGYIQTVDADDWTLGVVVGIVDKHGLPVTHPDADVHGTVTGDDTYTASSTNTSVDLCRAQVIISPDVIYYNDADDTLTAAMVGTFFDVNSSGDNIDVATSSATEGSWVLISRDPDGDSDASKGLFKIAESQLYAYAKPSS